EGEDPFPTLPLAALLREAAQPYEAQRAIRIEASPEAAPVLIQRSPELLHGLANLVANAARHAATQVTLAAAVEGPDLVVTISDDGTGFNPGLLPELGEPFLGPSRSGSGGTGLGIFIATTLLERTGGQIAFSNAPHGGARVEIRWRRTHIEQIDDRGR
ncbi:MAG: ATP-binding protein, partial [Sphingomonadaceae bacterium]|nr:ATP-binding protein [Sphingomonadaceae bacterium]